MRYDAVKAFGFLLSAVLALAILPAEAGFEFDSTFLEIGGGQSSAQVKQQISAIGEGQLPGVYRVDVSVNQRYVTKQDIRFVRTMDPKQSDTGLFPCLDIEFFHSQGVASKVMDKRVDADPTCVAFDQGLAGVTYDYDFNQQSLDIEIPQAYLGSIPFEVRRRQWSNGEAVAFTSYSLSGSSVIDSGDRRQDQFASFRSGVNAGAWRLRNFSTWRNGNTTPGRWESLESYVQRDMGSFMAIATLGDATTEGDLFDAIPYRGVGIASDLDMLPDDARQFAPVVRGIANGRSRVIIRQRGYVIKEQWVPSGPFAISDLYSTTNNGDLEVTVESADGQSQVYTQSFASVPYMLREGQTTYALYTGRYRSSSSVAGSPAPGFAQMTARRGLAGGTTLFGGGVLSAKYSAGLFGLAHDFAGFGAISLDVTHARSAGLGAENATASGQSFRFRYSKSVALTDTNFSLLGYRYSTGGYYSFKEALDSRSDLLGSSFDASVESLSRQEYRRGHMKSNFSANVSQQLGGFGSLYSNISKSAYWDKAVADTTIQLGYNFSTGNVSYSLALGVTEGQSKDRNVTFSVSMPLGDPNSRRRISASTSHSSSGTNSQMATLSGNALEDDVLSYNVGVARQSSRGQNSQVGSLSGQYEGARATLRGGYTQTGSSRQLDVGLDGSVVAYADQMMLGQQLGETNVIIAAPDAAQVSVAGKRGVRTNGNGYTVMPSAMPYRKNRVSLDSKTIAQNVDIEQLVQDVIPNRGAFVVANFATRSGHRILFRIADSQGKAAPFAANAQLFNAEGDLLASALIADNGRAFLTGVPNQARLRVSMGSETWCYSDLHLDEPEPASGIITMDIQCEHAGAHNVQEIKP
ncbi:fimbrial biogenesis outer membrane usher protein [Pseudomonas parafulva]|uniref:Fimbrial biogenesis outer membrane usher protein n=2 Tax=Pseudomonas TaxID=286 RepID=A0AAI8KG19_9PSED|nr:fimbrial protein [Pseudomonas parafulva]ATB68025.1 fimbrial biogenesis outer membrane usher protein [Pseudomonas mosselii]AXO90953.1 fimbrial biogenesis outer membrane usher protein [Pseudomonas parafulva]